MIHVIIAQREDGLLQHLANDANREHGLLKKTMGRSVYMIMYPAVLRVLRRSRWEKTPEARGLPTPGFFRACALSAAEDGA